MPLNITKSVDSATEFNLPNAIIEPFRLVEASLRELVYSHDDVWVDARGNKSLLALLQSAHPARGLAVAFGARGYRRINTTLYLVSASADEGGCVTYRCSLRPAQYRQSVRDPDALAFEVVSYGITIGEVRFITTLRARTT